MEFCFLEFDLISYSVTFDLTWSNDTNDTWAAAVHIANAPDKTIQLSDYIYYPLETFAYYKKCYEYECYFDSTDYYWMMILSSLRKQYQPFFLI